MKNINKALIRLLCGWVLLSFSLLAQAGFYTAMQLYQDKRFPEAMEAFEALAAIGDRSSLFNLGVMYYRGESVDVDPIKAYALMSIANEGLNDEQFSKVINTIWSRFTEEEKVRAKESVGALDKDYNIAIVRSRVLPKPLADEDCPPEVQPIKREPPRYPKFELQAGTMGFTLLEYTISPEGYVRDIIPISSTGKHFTRESVIAAKKFRYAPPVGGIKYAERIAITYAIAGDQKVNERPIRRNLSDLQKKADGGDVVAQYSLANHMNAYRRFKRYLSDDISLEHQKANEWYLKAAEGGLPHAQFTLGRNMLIGQGCEVDVESGYKWINAAALSGYSPAQRYLGESSFSPNDSAEKEAVQASVGWLKNAALNGDFPAKLYLAWELSTSAFPEYLNPEEALAMLDTDPGDYYDEVRILETKAAAYAAMGDFKKAASLQKKALKKAKKLDWEIPVISERLALYQSDKSFQGAYY